MYCILSRNWNQEYLNIQKLMNNFLVGYLLVYIQNHLPYYRIYIIGNLFNYVLIYYLLFIYLFIIYLLFIYSFIYSHIYSFIPWVFFFYSFIIYLFSY